MLFHVQTACSPCPVDADHVVLEMLVLCRSPVTSVYFAQLVQEGYSIFVVRGDFPPYQSSLEGRGKRFSLPQLRAAGTPARTPAKGNRRPRPYVPYQQIDSILSLRRCLCISCIAPSSERVVAFDERIFFLIFPNCSCDVLRPTPPNDDDDLAVAIALSMQQPPASSALTPAAAVVSPPGQAPAVGGGAAVASSSPSGKAWLPSWVTVCM